MPNRQDIFTTLKKRVIISFTNESLNKIKETSILSSYVPSGLIKNLAIKLKKVFPNLPSTNLGKMIKNDVETMGDLLDLIEKHQPVIIKQEDLG